MKLEVVRELLVEGLQTGDRLELLIYPAIYLKWINTGQIPCFEGGDHWPNSHAEISPCLRWKLTTFGWKVASNS
ncbi:hypothetical protein I3843_14G084600 [Carya illinoinensis]|uniref:Uncharacterized protein n=1 Tax=Carya illinoinensis TaxID=32201 RepID=A0A8T1NGB5_CARIL|nr:hypothetical protein I3760_14G085600 [Carya illinoinensis]KAG6629415.1 hypothetical protein CIPAW_14G082700 [Carya illinoinensis]KAG7947252.1 hypothetical protein I3843_14G084600 [Carya illinoinensis]